MVSRSNKTICKATGKLRYRTELDARIGLAGLAHKDGHARYYYPCRACRGWHTTKRRSGNQKRGTER